jgi:AcrR family transcriptional regulator
VRQIAERASIHASMITRYFETKDQLFALASDFPLHLPDLSAFDKSEIGERLSEQFILLWEGEQANGRLQGLFRASVSKEEARLTVVRIFEHQVRAAIRSIDGIDHPRIALALSLPSCLASRMRATSPASRKSPN